MAKCVRCGRPIPEGARLCARCSAAPGTPKPAPKQPRGMLAALIVLAVLTAAAFTLVIVQALGARAQRVQLRVREEALDATKRSLSDAQGEIAAQDEQLEQLRTELSDAQHAANQSQYDMTAQKAELERLREENAALQDSVTELEESEQSLTEENESLREQKDALTAERDELKEENQKLSEKSKFMDAYVVFVDNDKTGLYHKFGCSAFSRKSFWAYSRKLAESFGYTPCPKCFG